MIAKSDRRLRLEVGNGLEGAIPDAKAKRIIEEVIVPAFYKGNFYEGISKGVHAIIGLILWEDLPEREIKKKDNDYSVLIILGILIISSLSSILRNVFWGILIPKKIFSILVIILVEFSIKLLGIVLGVSIFGALITFLSNYNNGSSKDSLFRTRFSFY